MPQTGSCSMRDTAIDLNDRQWLNAKSVFHDEGSNTVVTYNLRLVPYPLISVPGF